MPCRTQSKDRRYEADKVLEEFIIHSDDEDGDEETGTDKLNDFHLNLFYDAINEY